MKKTVSIAFVVLAVSLAAHKQKPIFAQVALRRSLDTELPSNM
ncbi:MAG TPA: hypothetical protein VIE66_02755 [Methylocella sp.]|jgi:hypothetical protein